jgi:hypothetical protein
MIEAVWVGRPTPSRLPLVTQRWAALPPEAAGVTIVDAGSALPDRWQAGVRWRHVGDRLELAGSFFDGVNHIPEVFAIPSGPPDPSVWVLRFYPRLQTYGTDFALPTSIVTLKGEAAYFRSTQELTDDYVLYVVELERQAGNWLLAAGYAGESVTEERAPSLFNLERGLAKSIVAHAMYTGDPRRTVSVETAVRQNGDGVYVKGEYSYALTGHLRLTAAGVGIAGSDDDFIGQYHRNSSFTLGARFSF